MSLPCRYVAAASNLGQALVRTLRRQRTIVLDLPPELWLIVLSFMEKEELWVLVQVSQPFRALSLFPLLLRYDIPKSNIYSGSINLSGDACFLVPMIYNIHPILDITILLGSRRFRRIPSILAEVPQIPDVRIFGSIDGCTDFQITRLLWTLARNKADPVVTVGLGRITVSYLPVFKLAIAMREMFTADALKALLAFTCALIATAFLLCFVAMSWIVAGRAYARRFARRIWETSFDESVSVGGYPWGRMRGSSMRIQSISGAGRSQFTLVTFVNSDHATRWVMRPLPKFSSEQYKALLGVLNIEDPVGTLTVLADCSLNLDALLLFVHRHRLLTNLTLFSGAISSASLAAEPVQYPHIGRITTLTAPADCIAHFLPTERRVVDLTVNCGSDGIALARALDTIADLLDSESALHTLTLDFRTNEPPPLPWRAEPPSQTAAPLRGVKHLVMHWELFGIQYSTEDALGLPRWLARFPALVLLRSYGPYVPPEERPALGQAIAETRLNSDDPFLHLEFR